MSESFSVRLNLNYENVGDSANNLVSDTKDVNVNALPSQGVTIYMETKTHQIEGVVTRPPHLMIIGPFTGTYLIHVQVTSYKARQTKA